MINTYPDAFDAGPGDLLAVVELDALQMMAVLQVLQGHVSDEGAVVQLHHGEALLATGTAAQSSDAIICDQLAVGQRLSGTQQTVWKTNRGDGLELRGEAQRMRRSLAHYQINVYQCLQAGTVDGQLNQGVICHLRRGVA